MTRLPNPGSDDGQWGHLLNNYLTQEHHADGSHKVQQILQVPTSSGKVLTSDPLTTQGVSWQNIPSLPIGGAANSVLLKDSSANYDYTWQTLTPTVVGLSNVDNTSDADKPVSTAQQAALDQKVSKAQAIALAVAL